MEKTRQGDRTKLDNQDHGKQIFLSKIVVVKEKLFSSVTVLNVQSIIKYDRFQESYITSAI